MPRSVDITQLEPVVVPKERFDGERKLRLKMSKDLPFYTEQLLKIISKGGGVTPSKRSLGTITGSNWVMSTLRGKTQIRIARIASLYFTFPHASYMPRTSYWAVKLPYRGRLSNRFPINKQSCYFAFVYV